MVTPCHHLWWQENLKCILLANIMNIVEKHSTISLSMGNLNFPKASAINSVWFNNDFPDNVSIYLMTNKNFPFLASHFTEVFWSKAFYANSIGWFPILSSKEQPILLLILISTSLRIISFSSHDNSVGIFILLQISKLKLRFGHIRGRINVWAQVVWLVGTMLCCFNGLD